MIQNLDLDAAIVRQVILEFLSARMVHTDLSSNNLEEDYPICCDDYNPNSCINDFYDEFQLNSVSLHLVQPSVSDCVSRDLSSYSESTQEEVMRRYRYLTWIEKRLDGGWTQKNLDPLLKQAEDEIKLPAPKWRTLAQWWHLYSSSSKDIFSLIPKTEFAGNRHVKVLDDSDFFDQAVARYLIPERPSISAVYRYYFDSITLHNQHVTCEKIKPLSYKGFYNRIKKLAPYDVKVARYGKYLADKEFNRVDGHYPATRVLEKVEIDHTPLDLILLDDELNIPLGRPYLTILIDQFSRSIIGFHLGFKDPSYASVSKALLNAIRPKDYISQRFPNIEKKWYCHGKMESLVVDNGAEFWSNSLEQSCLELGINIQYNPVKMPWLKPLVERIFRTINSKLIVNIPGKTFSNIMEREGYDSKKDALMRFSTFNEILHTWIIDVYHYEANARKRLIPFLKWQEGLSQMPPLEYQEYDEQKLAIILGIMNKRKHRKGGITIHNLRYDSEELADYRRIYPSKTDVLIKTDPDDISFIYVYLESKNNYLKVKCVDPVGYTKGLSLLQHQVNVRLCRNFIDKNTDLHHLAKVRLHIDDLIAKEIEEIQGSNKRKKTKGMSRLAKYSGVASDRKVSVTFKRNPEIKQPDDSDKILPNDDEWDDYISDVDSY